MAVKARIEHEAMWVKVIKSIYGADGVMGDFVGMVDGRSRVWGDIMRVGRDIDRVGVCFSSSFTSKLGDGSRVTFGMIDGLPARVELDRKGIDLHSVLCSMCDNACESIDHGIVLCSEVIKVWSFVFGWWHLGNVNAFKAYDMLNHNGGGEMSSKNICFMTSGCMDNGILYLEKS
ncbi:hypothetical protein Tco_0471925 [Tanacetum coccineum]